GHEPLRDLLRLFAATLLAGRAVGDDASGSALARTFALACFAGGGVGAGVTREAGRTVTGFSGSCGVAGLDRCDGAFVLDAPRSAGIRGAKSPRKPTGAAPSARPPSCSARTAAKYRDDSGITSSTMTASPARPVSAPATRVRAGALPAIVSSR